MLTLDQNFAPHIPDGERHGKLVDVHVELGVDVHVAVVRLKGLQWVPQDGHCVSSRNERLDLNCIPSTMCSINVKPVNIMTFCNYLNFK